jgi:glycosyltransferase involved in cell wall biosynthesis
MGSEVSRSTIAFDARYVNDRYHGIGRHAYSLLEALTRLDARRHYLVYFHPDYPNRRFNLRKLAERANVELRPIRLSLYLPTEQIIWPIVLAGARASLFHSPYVALPVLARVPLVMTVHDLILERVPESLPRPWLRWCYQALTQVSVWRAARILTVSESTRGDIEAHYRVDAAKLCVIGNAVDSAFRRVTDPTLLAAVRDRYPLPRQFVLSVGAGRPHKNLAMLVDAFALLDRSFAPALVMAGESDPRFQDGVAARVRAHGLADRVLRPGLIREDDLRAVYSLADVLVFPSLVEGFGLPPLEAMACGTPVLASSASSIPGVVGDAALSFDPRDPVKLAALLEQVLQDTALRAELRQRGWTRTRNFSWDGVARATLAVYATVLGDAAPNPRSSNGWTAGTQEPR